MKIIDISWPLITTMTGYKNKKSFDTTFLKNFPHDHVRESTLTLNAHAGTHVDAPSHFLENGAAIESFSLDKLIGPCHILDCTHISEAITADDLSQFSLKENSIVLFKTKNSFLDSDSLFNPSFIYLEKSGAHMLASKKIKAVGIDYLGIERNQPDHKTHTILLKNNIPIIEGLRLASVRAGHYFFICLPLALRGNEASPARAIIIDKETL